MRYWGTAPESCWQRLLDLVTPHLHVITGLDAEEHKNNASLNHVLLFVMAIALQNIPEGMVVKKALGIEDIDVTFE